MSLTSDDLHDMKQLMEAVVGAAMKEQDKKFEKRFDAIDKRFDGIDNRLDDMDVKLDTIMDAVGGEQNQHDERLDDHEVRIARLERSAA